MNMRNMIRKQRIALNDINDTIAEYERSAEPLRRRIHRLNRMLAGEAGLAPGDTVKSLEARRYHLYCELAQLEQSISEMRDYVRCSTPWPTGLLDELTG